MTKPLWITYAWLDNDEGDFDYLTNQLSTAGIPATYDKISLIPGQRLWDQIAENITKGDLSGWAYLLTPKSIASEACREELAYALYRTLHTEGQVFPLIGLLHQVPLSEVPAALGVRLCVDLRSPDWIEQIRSGVENRPPSRVVPNAADFKVTAYNAYLGNPNLRAVEFTPRFGEIRYWCIAYPSNGPKLAHVGIGPANGSEIGHILHDTFDSTQELNGISMTLRGLGML